MKIFDDIEHQAQLYMRISYMLFEKERREESNCYIQRALDAVARSTHIEERYQIPESVATAF